MIIALPTARSDVHDASASRYRLYLFYYEQKAEASMYIVQYSVIFARIAESGKPAKILVRL